MLISSDILPIPKILELLCSIHPFQVIARDGLYLVLLPSGGNMSFEYFPAKRPPIRGCMSILPVLYVDNMEEGLVLCSSEANYRAAGLQTISPSC
jgi:hypothetical protein